MYTATITDFPISDDPKLQLVQATLTDDSGQPDIVRIYTLFVVNNPQPSDFQILIQADVDALNTAQTQATTLETQFAQTANLSIPLSSELQAVLNTTPPITSPPIMQPKITS